MVANALGLDTQHLAPEVAPEIDGVRQGFEARREVVHLAVARAPHLFDERRGANQLFGIVGAVLEQVDGVRRELRIVVHQLHEPCVRKQAFEKELEIAKAAA